MLVTSPYEASSFVLWITDLNTIKDFEHSSVDSNLDQDEIKVGNNKYEKIKWKIVTSNDWLNKLEW